MSPSGLLPHVLNLNIGKNRRFEAAKTLQREKFPIKTAFVLTISKVSGQRLKRAGIYLPSFFLLHVQLYVTYSRKSSFATIPGTIIERHWQRSEKKD